MTSSAGPDSGGGIGAGTGGDGCAPAAGVAGAVLAAGSGSRFGRPKGVVELGGTRLVDRAVAALADAGCGPVIAVVRAGVEVPGARVVVNEAPERGMASSLGLAVAAADGCAALAVVLVDMPGVGPDAIATVVRSWRPGRVAVATYAGRRAHPTVMAPQLWRDALAVAGPDEGARRFLSARAGLVDEIEVAGDPTDLDLPADLARWERVDDETDDGTDEVRLEILVQGRVQGVGFRYWTRERAVELGLRGSATNLADGRVRVIAEGPAARCAALRDAVTGDATPGVVLDSVVAERPVDPAAREPEGFRVR